MTRALKATRTQLRAYMKADVALLESDVTLPDMTARKAPRRKPVKKEAPRQIAIVTHLNKHLPEGSLVFHVPNHARSREHALFLARMGQRGGIPDLLVVVPHPCGQAPTRPQGLWFGLEVKDEGEAATSKQEYYHGVLDRLGCPCAVVFDVKGAVTFLEKWGVRFQ